jgi:DNA-directed RNA polymerase subunit beta'
MISKVPVIPTMFRPIAKVGDTALVSDINELYRDVIESADAFRQLKADVPDSGLAEERLNVYNAVRAAYGLGDPISPEGQAKKLKGAIRQVIGTSPKLGLWQSKVLSKAVDGVGRAVITPEPNYDMDQCGIPEDAAWTLYKDYVIRNLKRRGYSTERAMELVEKREPVAKDLLVEEMGRRPVILDRAPTWHKFNLMAFWPTLVKGDTMRMNPVVEKGFTADHDGDTMNFHVPASDKAVAEAIEKMLPSKNLFSTTDLRSPRYVPMMEMTLGLARLTAPASKAKPKVFVTARDAIRAYRRGEIGANDPVSVLSS